MGRKKKKKKRKPSNKRKLLPERRVDDWAYDRVFNFESLNLAKLDRDLKKLDDIERNLSRESRQYQNRLGSLGANRRLETLASLKSIRDQLNGKTKMIENARQSMQLAKLICERQLNATKRSVPILIGIATLDSLINEEPETYEYIVNSRLPFDFMFFEFLEPLELEMPFKPEKKEAIGIKLHRTDFVWEDNLPNYDYYATLYYQDGGKLLPLRIAFGPTNRKTFIGDFFFDRNNRTYFEVNIERGEVISTDDITLGKHLIKPSTEVYTNISEMSEPYPVTERTTITDKANTEIFRKISNLCVNLINYINAHNITIKKRIRNFKIKKRIKTGRVEEISINEPYHLITIKDGFIEESELPTGRSWELQWRVYVRGHNRRYRNERGEIYLITWVRPHIKGPPDAPWRENRYRDLAAKLEQEKRMYEEHLNKE